MLSLPLSAHCPALSPSTRFTLDGSEQLEKHLAETCQRVLAGVRTCVTPERLEALLLGGGYGRGEGGVFRTEGGDQPYNDLEFYVCLRGSNWLNEQHFSPSLHELGRTLSPTAGLEVEFKVLTLKKLRRSPVSMFYYDLMMRHRWLWGGESLLAGCARHCAARRIPVSEATRLLMNRCSGLLFAEEQLRAEPFTAAHADFIGRNQAKAQLAFGDTLLAAQGEYHWSCRERSARLATLGSGFPALGDVRRHHAVGVQFKLHPWRTPACRPALRETQEELSTLARHLWLWLESRRLNYPFASARAYATSGCRKCPEIAAWRSYLVNLRNFGPRVLLSRRAARYPRERVLQALPLLLWCPEVFQDPRLLRRLQSDLGTSATDFSALVEAYRRLWSRVN